jgi:hypothetical protein
VSYTEILFENRVSVIGFRDVESFSDEG